MIYVDDNPMTNIHGMTKKEVIYDMFVKGNYVSSNDLVRVVSTYKMLVSNGVIEENVDKKKINPETPEGSAYFINRHRDMEKDLVKSIDKILSDKEKLLETKEYEPRAISSEDLEEMIRRSTGVRRG